MSNRLSRLAGEYPRLRDALRISSTAEPPAIDPTQWRLVSLRAEETWPDGTLDVIEVQTLQPLSWLAEHSVRVGGEAPLPIDALEMGLPVDLRDRVTAVSPCPAIEEGSGRLVLTTVSHLNRDVLDLTLRDGAGREETLRPTGTHKFYSVTRDRWLSAAKLRQGEQLDGVNGAIKVAAIARLPGTHRVYNMTVQGEHFYRVASGGVLVHNNGCSDGFVTIAHGTSHQHAQEIMKNGLDAAKATGVRGNTGDFFTHEIGPPSNPGEGLFAAGFWGGNRHPEGYSVIIGKIPKTEYDRLVAAGKITVRPVPNLPHFPNETVFSSEIFDELNKLINWTQILPGN